MRYENVSSLTRVSTSPTSHYLYHRHSLLPSYRHSSSPGSKNAPVPQILPTMQTAYSTHHTDFTHTPAVFRQISFARRFFSFRFHSFVVFIATPCVRLTWTRHLPHISALSYRIVCQISDGDKQYGSYTGVNVETICIRPSLDFYLWVTRPVWRDLRLWAAAGAAAAAARIMT